MLKGMPRAIVAMLAVCMLLAPLGVAASQQPPRTADEEYVPVTGGEQEQLPAAPLVIGAYAVVWLAVLLYLWSIWRRLAHVEREIAEVARRIESGGAR
jgi:CcmD family protein